MDRPPAGARREIAPAQPSPPERITETVSAGGVSAVVTFAYDAKAGTVVDWEFPAAVEDLPARQGEALRTAVIDRALAIEAVRSSPGGSAPAASQH